MRREEIICPGLEKLLNMIDGENTQVNITGCESASELSDVENVTKVSVAHEGIAFPPMH